ncbi:hypothetical protein F7725_029155 [Dissostichus mawsoni]|uniref:Uncharacterized protein n=1 Tax=Dissostichus mawsoni TaxID=36200 RepID=A0A7J5XJ28_DISMA|nr:hypothetical protein F7725_029155 [Dissostichus mawsoni]
MLVGLTVKFLSFYRGENLDNMEPLCNCSGLNITPHFLTVNITSQSPRHVGKVSHGGLSTPHMGKKSCQNRGAEVNDRCVISVCQSVTFAKRRPLLPTERCHSPTQQICLLQETFDPEVLFNLFLPPIIFHGAYTLNQRRRGDAFKGLELCEEAPSEGEISCAVCDME